MGLCLVPMTLLPNCRAHYLLPLLPMWSLFLGGVIDRVSDDATALGRQPFKWALAVVLTLLASGSLALVVAFAWTGGPGAAAVIAVSTAILGVSVLGIWANFLDQAACSDTSVLAAMVLVVAAAVPVSTAVLPGPDEDLQAVDAITRRIPPGAPVASFYVHESLIDFRLGRDIQYVPKLGDLHAFLEGPGVRFLLVRPQDVDRSRLGLADYRHRFGPWRLENTDVFLLEYVGPTRRQSAQSLPF